MNKKLILAIAVLLGAAIFFVLKKNQTEQVQLDSKDDPVAVTKENSEVPSSSTPSAPSIDKKIDIEALSVGVAGTIKKEVFVPENKEEESLHRINQQLAKVFEHKDRPSELISFFEQQQLSPEMMEDSNEYTGTMLMIRTKKGLPGTRYYHAQYMGDNKDNTLLQHMSYEFKPGPNSMARAIQSAESTYQLSNKKIHRDGDFITYDIGTEGTHELSIEKANWESLKNDPFNAHSKEDVGTVITRIELKVHSDDESDPTHQHVD